MYYILQFDHRHVSLTFRNELINCTKSLYIGKCDKICPNYDAEFFKCERMKFCKNGSINLKWLKNPRKLFQDLYNRKHKDSAIFFKNIRLLNSLFDFTSIGEKPLNK